MRLIDADALNVSDIFCSYDTVTDLIDVEVWIDKAPTVDAVEVVRCCECKQHDHDGGAGYCNRWGKWSNMSDFCSYGERKEDLYDL